jgi:hypothetical protein
MAKDSDTALGRMRWIPVLLFPSIANIVFVSALCVLIFSVGTHYSVMETPATTSAPVN